MKFLFIGLTLLPPLFLMLRAPRIPLPARWFATCLYLAFGGNLVASTLGFSIGQVAGVALGAMLILNAVAERRRLPGLHAIDLLQFLLLILLLVNVLFVPQAPTAVVQAATVLLILAGVKALPQLDLASQLRALDAVVFGGLVVAAACVVEYVISPTLFGLVALPPSYELGLIRRITGLYGNPNAAAFYLCIGFVALLVRLRTLDPKWRIPAVAALGVTGFAALMTQSRAGFVVLMLAACAEVGRIVRRSRRGRSVALLVVVAAVGVFVVQTTSITAQLFPDRRYEELTTDLARQGRFRQAVDIAWADPLGGDPHAIYDGRRANYHNDVLQMTADHGVVIGLVFLAILLVLIRRLSAAAGDPAEPLVTAAAYVAVTGVTISMFHNVIASGLLFWLTVGAALVQRQHAVNQQRVQVRTRLTATPAVVAT